MLDVLILLVRWCFRETMVAKTKLGTNTERWKEILIEEFEQLLTK
jgi:hypothetical protein